LPEIVQDIGAYAGIASVVGLALLSALYFSQARDVRRLREWAGRAPERSEQGAPAVPGRVVAQPQPPKAPATPPQVPGKPVTPGKPAAATPAAAAAAGAGAATAQQGKPGGAPVPAGQNANAGDSSDGAAKEGQANDAEAAPQPATAAAAATGPASPGGSSPGGPARPGAPSAPGGPTSPGTAPPSAGSSAPPASPSGAPSAPDGSPSSAGPASPSGSARPPAPTPAARPPSTRQAATPAGNRAPSVPAGEARFASRPGVTSRHSPQETAILPPRPKSSGGLTARYLALALVGLLVLGGAAAYGVLELTGDDDGGSQSQGTPAGNEANDGGGPAKRKEGAVKPGNVTVAVLNGTTVPGLAATLSDQVKAAGFKDGTITNFSDQQLAESVVQYAPGHQAEARAVSRRLGIAQREPVSPSSQALAGDATVVVIAGADKAP